MTFFPAAGIAAFLYFDLHPDWFLNPGGSAPEGLWHVVEYDVDAQYQRGDWIVVCPSLTAIEHAQLFLDETSNDDSCVSLLSLKQIAAVPGDQVIVDFPRITTPLRTVEAVAVDRRGDELPRPSNGAYSVAEGTYWVLSEHALSVDSRYYGPVTTANIVKNAHPIVTMP